MNKSFDRRLDQAREAVVRVCDGGPASAEDMAWAEQELEKMIREERLTRDQALAILKDQAPTFYGIVALGVLPKPMTETERRQWAEQSLAEIMEKEGLSYDEVVASCRQHAPPMAEWLGGDEFN